MRRLRLLVIFFLVACSWSWGEPQASTSTTENDRAVARLAKAHLSAALETDSTPPFHLTATFETFDYRGKPDGEGTIEEFWDGSSRSRRTTTYRGKTQVRVLDRDEWLSAGPFESSLGLRSSVKDLFRVRLFEKRPNLLLEDKKITIGSADMDCIAVTHQNMAAEHQAGVTPSRNVYCLSSSSHLLRLIRRSDGSTTIYNNLQDFGPKTVAHELTEEMAGITRCKLHLLRLDSWTPDDETFIPPQPSTSYPQIDTSGAIERMVLPQKVSGNEPAFPLPAGQSRTSGEVILSAIISLTGAVKDIDVVSASNTMSAEALIRAVKTWKYRPSLLDHRPVEVELRISSNFPL